MTEMSNKQLSILRAALGAISEVLDQVGSPPNVRPEIQAEVNQKVADKVCLFCGETYGDRKVVRGVHFNPCYNKLGYRFRRKKKPYRGSFG